MRMMLRVALLTLLLQSTLIPTAAAWSNKEHILFTRIAILRLMTDPTTPAAMKEWLVQAGAGQTPTDMAGNEDFFLHTHVGISPTGFRGISYWVFQPDMRAMYDKADVKIEPFGVHEKVLHYLDLELLMPGDAKREYKHDLSNKPKISDLPRDMKDPRYVQAGMLPFRIEQCYGELVKAIRSKSFAVPQGENDAGKTATYWAAYLAHYLGDNTQPQHASMDYKSQSYFANKTRSPNVHAEVEYRMCDDEVKEFAELRKEYWAMFQKQLAEFKDPVKTRDQWLASVEVLMQSYDALPLIGLAAMRAGKQAGTPEKPEGAAVATADFDTEAFFRFRGTYMGREMSVTEMKAIQTAWAVLRIEKAFRQAWDDALSETSAK